MSPHANGGKAGEPLWVLASIVSVHGPGAFEDELARAAALHLDGPPEHYQSAWSNQEQIISLLQAIALAGVLRTPDLLSRLERWANSTPEEIENRTGHYVPRPDSILSYVRILSCVRAALSGTEAPINCDPTRWARPR